MSKSQVKNLNPKEFNQPELQGWIKNPKFPALFNTKINGTRHLWVCWVTDNKIYRTDGDVHGKMKEPIPREYEGNTVKTPEQQAQFEAEKMWMAQLNKGYKPDESDKNGMEIYNKVLEQKNNNGGISRGVRMWGETQIKAGTTSGKVTFDKHIPMLAKTYLDNKDKVVFPCYVQAKVDGMRCRAYLSKGECILESRDGNSYMFLDHIKDEIKSVLINHPDLVLDGELYIHVLYKNKNGDYTFDYISKGGPPNEELRGVERYQFLSRTCKTSLKKAHPLELLVEFWVFDIWDQSGMSFDKRFDKVEKVFSNYEGDIIKLVPTFKVNSHEEIEEKMKELIGENDFRQGYDFEGVMIRKPQGQYIAKAKYHCDEILKYKRFIDEEWFVTGAKESQGTQKGAIVWECKIEKEIPEGSGNKKTLVCNPKQMGDINESRKLWNQYKQNPNDFLGKPLTIQYNEVTKDYIPRFPRAVGIRDETDL